MSGRAGLLRAALAVFAAGLVYVPSLSGGYVYDDHRFVRLNPAVMDGAALSRYFTDPSTQTADDSFGGLYRPLRTLSFRLVALVSRGAPAQRAAGLALHLLNGLLLWILLRRILGAEPGLPALLGSLAFLLHPLATESVAFISSRGDLLAMTGMLGALVLHLAPGRGARIGAICCFVLALLSKESAVVLPVLLVIVDGFCGGWRAVRAGLWSYAPHVIVLGLFVALRFLVLGSAHFGQGPAPGGGGSGALASVLAGEGYYLFATLFPTWLSFELDLAAGAVPATIGFFLVAGLLLSAILVRDSARPLTLAVLWFLAALIPVTILQFVMPLKIEVANRFAYPALAAFGILLAFASSRRRPAAVLALLVLAAFVPLTMARAGVWREERALWEDVLRAQPGHARALYALGVLDLGDGDPAAARDRLLRAARLNPEDPKVAVYLGRSCRELAGRFSPGSPEFRRHLMESRSAYQAAIQLWMAGVPSDRALFRSAALEAAWLAMVAGDPDLAAADTRIMLDADGQLVADARTVRHLEELSRFLMQVRHDDLAASVELLLEPMIERGSR